ncbi:S8 family serine peptidase [Nocardiopsis lambiniae]|uniref:S8 family serine peptidase n=1 Tax=Nocardiopsis lambiniae TaxID=3075539 RepID=A0ABU2M8B7_9ACTN|nr:S8 family serine peptidase [Nocardiopsis sp. DSM 44743]MDT0328908.1 S8 family serine peptidase [Nocardiopsis sp. DSM 44743]
MLGGICRNENHTGIAAIAAVTVLGLTAAPAAADGVPDFRPEQWGLQSVNAQELWSETQGQGITVGLPGASVYDDHPDLVDNVTIDDEFGTNDGDAETGSAAAALVAGHGHGMDADGGVLGVAPDAGLLIIPTEGRLAAAVRHAAESGAQVVLLPEIPEGADLTGATRDAVAMGALVVGPAGGAADPNVLAVGGIDENAALIPDSPEPGVMELVAPGADLETAGPDMGQAQVTGTEYAAAMTAGAAALLRSAYPQLRPEQVRAALVEGGQEGPDGLPSLHLPGARALAAGDAQDVPLVDQDLADRADEGGGVPLWAWFVTGGAVLLLGLALVVVWVRRSSADPYGVKAQRALDDAEIADERAAEARPASRRKKGGRRRRG